MRDYMQGYRKTQSEKGAERDARFNEAYDLMEEFVREQMKNGYSEEQAVGQFKQATTPPEDQPEETQPCGTATDSVVEKPDCFGQKFHGDSEKCTCSLSDDCHKAWVANLFKPQAVKDAERHSLYAQKIVDWLEKSKALREPIERRERAELAAKVQAIEDAQEKEFEADVKKYTDRGIPEKQARESATWEQKQKQNAEISKNREFQRKWELMTEEQKTEEKLKALKDSKKLRGGE
jgi:hypothetical protein